MTKKIHELPLAATSVDTDIFPMETVGNLTLKVPRSTILAPTSGAAGVVLGTNWGTTDLQVKKSADGLVFVNFQASPTGAASGTMLTLPIGYRPTGQVRSLAYYYDVSTTTTYTFQYYIATSGAIEVYTFPAGITPDTGDICYVNMTFSAV